jgi:hypothetical protein
VEVVSAGAWLATLLFLPPAPPPRPPHAALFPVPSPLSFSRLLARRGNQDGALGLGVARKDEDEGWVQVLWDSAPGGPCMAYRYSPPLLADVVPYEQLCVGDSVRVRAWVAEPAAGWGGVARGDVGRVTAVEAGAATVHFAGQADWVGQLWELEKLLTG